MLLFIEKLSHNALIYDVIGSFFFSILLQNLNFSLIPIMLLQTGKQ